MAHIANLLCQQTGERIAIRRGIIVAILFVRYQCIPNFLCHCRINVILLEILVHLENDAVPRR
jgi:hypothetical protein